MKMKMTTMSMKTRIRTSTEEKMHWEWTMNVARRHGVSCGDNVFSLAWRGICSLSMAHLQRESSVYEYYLIRSVLAGFCLRVSLRVSRLLRAGL